MSAFLLPPFVEIILYNLTRYSCLNCILHSMVGNLQMIISPIFKVLNLILSQYITNITPMKRNNITNFGLCKYWLYIFGSIFPENQFALRSEEHTSELQS